MGSGALIFFTQMQQIVYHCRVDAVCSVQFLLTLLLFMFPAYSELASVLASAVRI